MPTIILVRHGESVDNVRRVIQSDECPLSENGRMQAREMAKELSGDNSIVKIITSTTRRAEETAEIIQKNIGIDLDMIGLKGLSSSDSGSVTGTKLADLQPLTPIEFAEKQNTGESRADVFNRVNNVWFEIKKDLRALGNADKVVLVSHRSTLSMIESIEAGKGMDGGVEARKRNKNKKHGIWGELTI